MQWSRGILHIVLPCESNEIDIHNDSDHKRKTSLYMRPQVSAGRSHSYHVPGARRTRERDGVRERGQGITQSSSVDLHGCFHVLERNFSRVNGMRSL